MDASMIKPTTKGFFVKQYLPLAPFALALTAGGILAVLLAGVDWIWGALLFALGALAIAAPLAHSAFHTRATSISFDGDKLVFETGILDHRKKKIPINMVTDSSANRTFIEKFFGTGTFNISTSGSSGYEIVCHGLDYRELEKFHGLIYERIKHARTERPAA